jgi:hypothetical protein
MRPFLLHESVPNRLVVSNKVKRLWNFNHLTASEFSFRRDVLTENA